MNKQGPHENLLVFTSAYIVTFYFHIVIVTKTFKSWSDPNQTSQLQLLSVKAKRHWFMHHKDILYTRL